MPEYVFARPTIRRNCWLRWTNPRYVFWILGRVKLGSGFRFFWMYFFKIRLNLEQLFQKFWCLYSTFDFHLHKWKESFLQSLINTYNFLISEKSATCTVKWSYTIIWQVRVFDLTPQDGRGHCIFKQLPRSKNNRKVIQLPIQNSATSTILQRHCGNWIKKIKAILGF